MPDNTLRCVQTHPRAGDMYSLLKRQVEDFSFQQQHPNSGMSIPTGTDWINRRTGRDAQRDLEGSFFAFPTGFHDRDLARIGEARRVLRYRPLNERCHILEDRWDDGADIITMIAPWWWWCGLWRCFHIENPPSSSAILLIKVLRDSGVGALILLSSEGRGLAWCFLPTV